MRSSAERIKVLVVEDHAGVREGIRAVVDSQPDMKVVGEANNGEEAIQQFKRLLPDITVTDVAMPVVCGLEAIALLRQEFPQARFIVISATKGSELAKKAFAAGAQAFLHKDMLRRELLPAIRAVHSGQRYVAGIDREGGARRE